MYVCTAYGFHQYRDIFLTWFNDGVGCVVCALDQQKCVVRGSIGCCCTGVEWG